MFKRLNVKLELLLNFIMNIRFNYVYTHIFMNTDEFHIHTLLRNI